MPLEKQVVSLDIAKRLKELGVKQESLFYWRNSNLLDTNWDVKNEYFLCDSSYEHDDYGSDNPPRTRRVGMEEISAFTVAELGEMLPKYVKKGKISFCFKQKGKDVGYEEEFSDGEGYSENLSAWIFADTEADARGKMLVYLLENKLITV